MRTTSLRLVRTAGPTERLLYRGEGSGNMLVRVRRRQERSFELATGQIYSAVHHRPEEACELHRVALAGALIIPDRPRVEKERKHAADPGNAMRSFRGGSLVVQPRFHGPAKLFETRVGRVVA